MKLEDSVRKILLRKLEEQEESLRKHFAEIFKEKRPLSIVPYNKDEVKE